MKTKYKYIEFIPEAQHGEAYYSVINHRYNDRLGELEYNKKWKQWEFVPECGTGYTKTCLLDLADFIDKLNDQTRNSN